MARAILELIGDPDSLLKSFKKSSAAADKFGRDLKQLGTTADQSARAQIQAATKRDARLRQEISAYRQVAQAAQKGSREQIAAANLAVRAEERLGRSLAITSREAKQHARSVATANRELSRLGRGAVAGSGLAGFGRTLAFASGGFLASASIVGFLRSSIEQGSEAAATQKQLAAQFKAAGQNLKAYQGEIDAATNSLSQLAGIEDDQLKAAFVTAFRGSQNVSVALKIQAAAADVARGRHIELSTATIALTKAYGGQVTALRRLGIQVPPTLHGLAALNFVQARFAGQAKAGTTAQDRFNASMANFKQAIGLGLLPTFTKLLTQASKWLNNTENQKRIQHDASEGAKVLGGVLGGVGKAYGFLTSKQGQALTGFTLTKATVRTLGAAWHVVNKELSSYQGNLLKIGAGDREMRGAQAMRIQNAAAALAGGSVNRGGPRPRASLTYQLSLLEERLAKAELTAGTKDDRAVLLRQAALTRQKIAKTKELGARTALYQSLGSIESQIAAIDGKNAADRKASQDKRLAAMKQQLADQKAAAQKELSVLKQREATLKDRIKSITSAFSDAVATARGGIGALFGGPVLNFSDEQRKAALGIPNMAADPRALVKDLNAQVRQAAAFQRNLVRLGKRGAPAGLIKELQAGGVGNAAQVAALAGASKGTLQQFFKAFGAREKLVQSIARAEMHVQLATLHADRVRLTAVRAQETKIQVFIEGVEQKQAKVKVKQSAAQRRGPVPGRS